MIHTLKTILIYQKYYKIFIIYYFVMPKAVGAIYYATKHILGIVIIEQYSQLSGGRLFILKQNFFKWFVIHTFFFCLKIRLICLNKMSICYLNVVSKYVDSSHCWSCDSQQSAPLSSPPFCTLPLPWHSSCTHARRNTGNQSTLISGHRSWAVIYYYLILVL